MQHPGQQFAIATPSHTPVGLWRYLATAALMVVCAPAFLIGALVAGVVALPLLLLAGIGRAAQVAHGLHAPAAPRHTR